MLVMTTGVLPAVSGAQATHGADSARPAGLLAWRSIGPSRYGGRVEDIAVPLYPRATGITPGAIMYVAASTGGVFKTTDGGVRWVPVFDSEPSAAVHTIAIHPQHPELMWVGTGDPTLHHTVTPGTGVYKSADGGVHWTHVGLDSAVVVSRLALDPANPDVAYAAVTGSFARPGGMRGVYKTSDGGLHWARLLTGANGWTGAVDLAVDPSNPQVVYAAFQQRGQSPELDLDYGPGTGIYKTTDGGQTWIRLAGGLPTGNLGSIALAVSPVRSSTVYVAVISPSQKGGYGYAPPTMYRSDDAGVHWERGAQGEVAGWPLRVVADPADPMRVFVMGSGVDVFTDGGKAHHEDFSMGGPQTSDYSPGDTHAMWIDPEHPQHWVVGEDWGIEITYDAGRVWTLVPTLPIGQFRYVDADRRTPFYWVYGESQDHMGDAGPSRTRAARGIAYTDWISTAAPEGQALAVDPLDSATLYSWSMAIMTPTRSNVETQEARKVILDPPQWEVPDHWGWDAPVVISPYDHRVVYAGQTRLFRSTDRGEHWTAISPELVRPVRRSLTLMGLTDVHERAAKYYDNLSTMAESPLERGVLYAGTRDGLFHASRDAGQHWRTVDEFPGVPAGTMLTRVVPSQYTPGTVYLTVNAADAGDFRPHVLKSTDHGLHWSRLSTEGLPSNAAAWVIREHFRTRGLLFLGTDVGVFYSADSGSHWRSLRRNMPAVRVRDLVVQPQWNDLVAGTYGRSLWILDDLAPIEHLAAAEARPTPTLFPVRDAVLPLHPADQETAGQPVAAPNPEPALFSYYIPSRYGQDSASLRIRDASGGLVDTVLRVPTGAGLHRVGWHMLVGKDIWYPQPEQLLPGRYRVQLAVGSSSDEQQWTVRSDPLTPVDPARLDSIIAMRTRAGALRGRLRRTVTQAQALRAEVDSALAALIRQGGSPPPALRTDAQRLHVALDSVLAINTDPLKDTVSGGVELAIDNAYHVVGDAVTAPPVPALGPILDTADTELAVVERTLAAIRDIRLPAFRSALKTAGVALPSRPPVL